MTQSPQPPRSEAEKQALRRHWERQLADALEDLRKRSGTPTPDRDKRVPIGPTDV